MMTSCCNLFEIFRSFVSEFFENLAFEAKIDSEKSVMIKNSIHARKAIVRRARTMRFEASRKRRSKGVLMFTVCVVCTCTCTVMFVD